jgi:hypothetical protein
MPHGDTRPAPAVFQPRGGPSTPTSWHHKKSGAEHSFQRHSSSPTGLSGGCAKPIFDHAHERSAKRQGERGLILCPLSNNLPYRSRRVELRFQQRRKTEEAGFELSVPRSDVYIRRWRRSASVQPGYQRPRNSRNTGDHLACSGPLGEKGTAPRAQRVERACHLRAGDRHAHRLMQTMIINF